MVDSRYSTDDYKSLNINIAAITKNLQMLRFILDHLKTKRMCEILLKKLSFVIRYVPD